MYIPLQNWLPVVKHANISCVFDISIRIVNRFYKHFFNQLFYNFQLTGLKFTKPVFLSLQNMLDNAMHSMLWSLGVDEVFKIH